MKKLFLLLTAVLLSAGMVVQAQETPSVAFFDYNSDDLNFWEDYSSFSTFNKTADKFLQMEFTQMNKTSNNYVMFTFWVDDSHCRIIDGLRFPANGTYYKRNFIADGLYGSSCNDALMYITVESDSYLNAAIMGQGQDFCSSDCGYSLCNTGANDRETYWASYNNGSVTGYNYTIATVIISDGVGKYPCIKAYDSSSNLLIKIDLKMEDGTITAVSNNNSYGTVTGTAGASTFVNGTEYPSGTSISLTAVPAANYSLLEWRDGDGNQVSTNTSINFNVNGNASYTAVFAPTHTITVTSEDASKGTTTGGGTYAEGASVTISASGLNGYVFSQWSDGNTNNPRTVTVGNADASYTAQFILQPMSIATCSDAAVSFHCDYSDVISAGVQTYLYKPSQDSYCNEIVVAAKNANNAGFQIVFTRTGDTNYGTYTGGECNNIDGPYPSTYNLNLAQRTRRTSRSSYYWRCQSGNSVVCYATSGGQTCAHYSYIMDGKGNTINIRSHATEDGTIIVSENNVGGIFFETNSYVLDYNRTKSIYFTFGNRSENTINLGTGTMSMTPSGLTMSASNGNHSASIKLNNSTTGNKTLADFDVNNSCFVYNGTPFSEISNITGTLTQSGSTYTLTVKIRDCEQNLYIVTMSAVAATTYALSWDPGDGELDGTAGVDYTPDGYYEAGTPIIVPHATREGYHLTEWDGDAVNSYTPDECGTEQEKFDVDEEYVARWAANTHNVSWVTDGNALTGTYTNGTTAYGTTIVAPNTPTKTATAQYTYTFNGWTPAVAATMPDNDVTYTATWTETPVNYTLTWTTDGNALTGDYTHGTVAYGTTIAQPATPTKNATAEYTYTFNGWSPTPTATMPAANTEYTATWTQTPVNYTLTWTTDGDALTGDYTHGTVAYGTTIAQPATPTKTGYTFNVWSPTPAATMPAANTEYTATWTAKQYNITYKDQGDAAFSGVHGSGYPTKHTYGSATELVSPTKSGYNFLGWYDNSECTGDAITTIAANSITADITLYAKWEVAARTVTITAPTNGTITVSYNDGSAQSFTSGSRNIAPGTTLTITAVGTSGHDLATLTVGGKAFTSGNTLTLTENITIVATFGITLCESCNNTHYNSFLDNDGRTENVIYNRTFEQGRWSTLCLPFNVSSGQMTALKMKGRVYEFNHAEGDANIGDELVLYFAAAKSLEAGKCYIVNANSALAGMSSFTFSNVTINLTADSVPDLTIAGAYDNLGGYKQSGNIELIGTLRKGTLKGTGENERYMGLKDNKIYYPNTDPEKGSTVLAYRGVFRSTTALNAQRIRIVAEGDEGEEVTELEVVNGELQAVPEVRKFIRDGVLYIEREGVIYDAAGQRVE